MLSVISSLNFLSIFFAGTDNSEFTVAWYHRMISAQFPLRKKETTKRETWIKQKTFFDAIYVDCTEVRL